MVSVISGVATVASICARLWLPTRHLGNELGRPRPFIELAGEITPERAQALEKRGFQGSYLLEFPARWMDISAFGGTNAVFIDPRTGMLAGVPDPRRSGAARRPRPVDPARCAFLLISERAGGRRRPPGAYCLASQSEASTSVSKLMTDLPITLTTAS